MQSNHIRLILQKCWEELPYEVPPKRGRFYYLYITNYDGSATKDAQGRMVQGYKVAMLGEGGKLEVPLNSLIGKIARFLQKHIPPPSNAGRRYFHISYFSINRQDMLS